MLVFDLLPGLVIAVALSLVLFIAYASAPRIAVLGRRHDGEYFDLAYRPDLQTVPGLLIVRPDGGLFFGNADRVRHRVQELVDEITPTTVVCLVLNASFHLGLPVLDSLADLHESLRRRDVELWLAEVPTAARAQLDQDVLAQRLGSGRIWPSIEAAKVHFQSEQRP